MSDNPVAGNVGEELELAAFTDDRLEAISALHGCVNTGLAFNDGHFAAFWAVSAKSGRRKQRSKGAKMDDSQAQMLVFQERRGLLFAQCRGQPLR